MPPVALLAETIHSSESNNVRGIFPKKDNPKVLALMQEGNSLLAIKVLVIDVKMQSAEIDEFIYHGCLIQPALLCHPNVTRQLCRAIEVSEYLVSLRNGGRPNRNCNSSHWVAGVLLPHRYHLHDTSIYDDLAFQTKPVTTFIVFILYKEILFCNCRSFWSIYDDLAFQTKPETTFIVFILYKEDERLEELLKKQEVYMVEIYNDEFIYLLLPMGARREKLEIKLSSVDLAGCEKVRKSQSSAYEAAHISFWTHLTWDHEIANMITAGIGSSS
ncbi:thermospermine synthase acaulis5 [Phtheirospermum japonicum]|uniref:Thermospermine synthase acaulis5 n=1 Tax=Phtheirospermum japonicum TaxID=374723 RepID=A0A830CRM4_9LAMI|nr:thermospermine synthase acaulis5 [Phtheirospermum japonicum]